MRHMLPVKESCDAMFRYAWYTARHAPSDDHGGILLIMEGSKEELIAQPELSPRKKSTRHTRLPCTPMQLLQGGRGGRRSLNNYV